VLSVATDESEHAAIAEWLDGDGSTASVAAAMRLTDLPAKDQREAVKRFKDRIVKRIKRKIGNTGEKGETDIRLPSPLSLLRSGTSARTRGSAAG
jgi:hypothetical protein